MVFGRTVVPIVVLVQWATCTYSHVVQHTLDPAVERLHKSQVVNVTSEGLVVSGC